MPFNNFENYIGQDVFRMMDELENENKMQHKEKESQNWNLIQYAEKNMINIAKTRKIEAKLERIKSLEGIDKFKQIEQLYLSSNIITQINQNISYCLNLIEINLSQNQIIGYEEIGNLKNLRVLNLEMNLIREINKLKNCDFLEYYNLSTNNISKISNLENLLFLKRLILFKNQVKFVSDLEGNCYLEEIDLGNNQILLKQVKEFYQKTFREDHNPFENCICLRKLILYNNHISKLPKKIRMTLLNELWLNGNGLENLEGLEYLPLLENLYCQDNNLECCFKDGQSLCYFPSLKRINLSRNNLKSFGTIQLFVEHSSTLVEIDFLDNPFLFQLSQEVLQLQQYMLMTISQQLRKLNNQIISNDYYDFFKQKFDQFIHISCLTMKINQFVLMLQQNNSSMKKLNQLQERKLQQNHPFSFTETYKVLQVTNDIFYLNIDSKSSIQNLTEFEMTYFDLHYKRSMMKVQSCLLKWIYKTRKRNRYYKKNIAKVIKTQAYIRGRRVRQVIRLDQILQSKKFASKGKDALKIQKVFRGYRLRKKYLQLMKQVKYEDKEIDEFEEFNDDFFNQPIKLDYDLKIPDGINFAQLYQQSLTGKNNQQPALVMNHEEQKFHPQPQRQGQQMQAQQQHELINNSSKAFSQKSEDIKMKQSNYSQNTETKFSQKSEKIDAKKIRTKVVSQEEIMKDWGFSKPEVAQAFAFRMEKNNMRKEKNKEKNLSAEERYQKFLKNKGK